MNQILVVYFKAAAGSVGNNFLFKITQTLAVSLVCRDQRILQKRGCTGSRRADKRGRKFGKKERLEEGRIIFFSADLAFESRLPIIPHLICCHNKKQVIFCICTQFFSSATC